MQRVIVVDDRPKWMVQEDKMMACFTRCHLYKKCSSRFGFDCKRMGGNNIPKLGGGRSGK